VGAVPTVTSILRRLKRSIPARPDRQDAWDTAALAVAMQYDTVERRKFHLLREARHPDHWTFALSRSRTVRIRASARRRAGKRATVRQQPNDCRQRHRQVLGADRPGHCAPPWVSASPSTTKARSASGATHPIGEASGDSVSSGPSSASTRFHDMVDGYGRGGSAVAASAPRAAPPAHGSATRT
jgi:hypothetical protein